MEILGYMILGAIALFVIVFIAVKIAVKEALREVKEDIIKEFNIKKANEDANGIKGKIEK